MHPRKTIALLFALLLLFVSLPYAPRALHAETNWSAPVDVSQSSAYDNTPSIAATASGAVTIAWERRLSDSNAIIETSNSSLGGPFKQQSVGTSAPRTSGGTRAAHDSLGRRHIVWWQYTGSTVCDYYARVDADGQARVIEQVPSSCGLNLKNTAVAVGPDNSVHALFGQNMTSLYYWVRTDAGWTVRAEPLPAGNHPSHIGIGVTTAGTVMAVWSGDSAKGTRHIFSGIRAGAGNWALEDASGAATPACDGDSRGRVPMLAADPSGGMRMSWLDSRCDPAAEGVAKEDLFYREWSPGSGWGGLPPVRIGHGSGNGFEDAIAVDGSGAAHIMWVDNFRIYYAAGRGSNFSQPATPFADWAGGTNTKDVFLDYNAGYLHVVFSSEKNGTDKDNYYTYRQVYTPPPPPTPTPTPLPSRTPPLAPPVALPGTGSRLYPETGYTVPGLFLDYWNGHGGLMQQGFPISQVMGEVSEVNGKPYTVQYFERAVFEYHPENQPPYNVLLSLLGRLRYTKKYGPEGAPGQRPNNDPGSVYFPETGKHLGGSFLQYWQQHGGLAQQGYPISDEMTEVSELDGKPYTVQYFERAEFEWHPDNPVPYDVLLVQLGTLQFRQKYGGR